LFSFIRRKRLIFAVLLFVISLSWAFSICPSPSFAKDILVEAKPEAPEALFEETAKLEDAYKGHSPFERMISGLFTAISQSLYTMLGLRDPLELIFDYEPMVKVGPYQSRDELYLGIFSDSEASMVAGIYAKLIKYAPIFLVMVVAGVGLYLMIYGAIGDMRMEGKQILTGSLVGVIALAVGPHLMDACFSAMYGGVEIFKDMIEQAVQAKGVATPKSLIGVLLSGMMTQYADMPVDQMAEALTAHVSSLGYAIVLFIVFLSAGIINWQYFMRKLTLALLIILFPPAAMVSVLPSHRQVLQTWFVEFITAASLVLVHAVVYSFLILLTLSIGRPFGFFEILIYSLGLVTASTYVRQLFVGGREGAFRAAAGTAGLRAILGTLALKDAGKVPKQLPRGDSSGPPPNRPGGSPGPSGSSPKQRPTPPRPTPTTRYSAHTPDAGHQPVLAQANDRGSYQPKTIVSSTTSTPDERQPGKTLTKDPEVKSKTNTGWVNAARTGGLVVGATAGTLLAGAVFGNTTGGAVLGGTFGAKVSEKAAATVGGAAQSIRRPQNFGVFTTGQLLDSKTASEISKEFKETRPAPKAPDPYDLKRLHHSSGSINAAPGWA
jgi:hypothetical protein